MILILPQGSHTVRLGNDAEISQEVSGVKKGLVYSVMFAVARMCARRERRGEEDGGGDDGSGSNRFGVAVEMLRRRERGEIY
ncbi:hypothetical protein RHGRI_017150 [Rhododendron griersonianum]|uniref:DUF642 domain-containing protein n=1 Tax=Rhododendron griersonianum TaxID=479676 RepID=A0AAV6JWT9_9ERIC|nr:hypothetical protein RHGRI_017150 [Rhododendron griersonianum]